MRAIAVALTYHWPDLLMRSMASNVTTHPLGDRPLDERALNAHRMPSEAPSPVVPSPPKPRLR